MPRELGATRLQGLLEEAQDLSEEEREFEEKVIANFTFELESDMGSHSNAFICGICHWNSARNSGCVDIIIWSHWGRL